MKSRYAEPQTPEAKNGKMKQKSDKAPPNENEVFHNEKDKDKHFLKESLLLPSTSIGKTTSASICERSNVWAEHRLDEKKNDLDHMLYKKMVRLNSDRLEVVSELANLKKSSSTGNLAGMDGFVHSRGRIDVLHSRSKSNSGQFSPAIDRKTLGDGKHTGHTATHIGESMHKPGSASPTVSQKYMYTRRHSQDTNPGSPLGKLNRKTIVSKLENSAKISVKLGSDSSSDESESTGKHDSFEHHENTSDVCMKHGHTCRGCMEERSQSQLVENVTRRYAKQLSAKKGEK